MTQGGAPPQQTSPRFRPDDQNAETMLLPVAGAHSVTGRSSHYRNTGGTAILGALEAELSALAWLQSTIPAQIAGAVGITTGQVGIPAVGDAGTVAVTPADIPSIDWRGAVVGDTDGAGKAVTPLVGNHILTTAAAACHRTGG